MIDVDRQLVAVTRTVTDREADARQATVVTLEQTYDTDPDDLWNAIADPQRLACWFAPVTGDLRLGGRYRIEGNARGTVTACEPPRRFDATWEFDGAVSWIEARVTPDGAGRARLTLRHIADRDEHWDRYGPGAAGIGWELGLCGLALHIATGVEVPPEFADWPASPDGVRFMTGSGRAWGQAHAASGESHETAATAADRAIGFYTGAQPAD